MKNNILKKGLIVAIILLFIGSGLASGYHEICTSSKYDCLTIEDSKSDYVFNEKYPTMTPIPIESIIPETNVLDITLVDTPDDLSMPSL